jgi:hypothetical protein
MTKRKGKRAARSKTQRSQQPKLTALPAAKYSSATSIRSGLQSGKLAKINEALSANAPS